MQRSSDARQLLPRCLLPAALSFPISDSYFKIPTINTCHTLKIITISQFFVACLLACLLLLLLLLLLRNDEEGSRKRNE